MQYDNRTLCEYLNHQDKAVELASAFLANMQREMSEENEDPTFREWYCQAAKAHVSRELAIIGGCAESPIERILLSSLVMNSIRSHDPMGLVVTRPMRDAERNMDELRDGIQRLHEAAKLRADQGGDMSPSALLDDLEDAFQRRRMDDWERDLNFHMLWCYHFFPLENALHLTPQATFPALFSEGRAARADILCWIPAHRDCRLIVECDSYAHHDNRKAFDYDRRRSRVFQRKGFGVLQFSGGEIYRDPIGISSELYDRLTDEAEKHSGPAQPDAQQGAAADSAEDHARRG
jgi:hypothetical protein